MRDFFSRLFSPTAWANRRYEERLKDVLDYHGAPFVAGVASVRLLNTIEFAKLYWQGRTHCPIHGRFYLPVPDLYDGIPDDERTCPQCAENNRIITQLDRGLPGVVELVAPPERRKEIRQELGLKIQKLKRRGKY